MDSLKGIDPGEKRLRFPRRRGYHSVPDFSSFNSNKTALTDLFKVSAPDLIFLSIRYSRFVPHSDWSGGHSVYVTAEKKFP